MEGCRNEFQHTFHAYSTAYLRIGIGAVFLRIGIGAVFLRIGIGAVFRGSSRGPSKPSTLFALEPPKF